MSTQLLAHEPYPLEEKFKEFFNQDFSRFVLEPTGITRETYLDLVEPIVMRAANWQDERGAINDPYENRERRHVGSIFVFGLSTLISAGRCLKLLDKCILSMDACCHDLYERKVADHHADFCTELLVHALRNLSKFVSSQELVRWQRWLGGFDPEKTYREVENSQGDGCTRTLKPASSLYNWNLFAVAGEWLKKYDGIANNLDFVEKYLRHQVKHFTAYGMYKDPGDPICYDQASRLNIGLLLRNGYDGVHQEILSEMARRGSLTMLFMQSTSGETPYGGRSNQAHVNEAVFASICELETFRYKTLGDFRIAGAFKRAARLAAISLNRWLLDSKTHFIFKNFFPPRLRHGYDPYVTYSHGGLTAVFGLAFAYLYADDSIKETLAPCEVGGYIFELPGDFHKIFATSNGIHLAIDTHGDFCHDPTGLGRIHKKGIPSELGLSMGIVKNPNYLLSVPSSQINLAIGPGWEDKWGRWYRLAEYSSEIENVNIKILKEAIDQVHFSVEYQGKFRNCDSIMEEYDIREGKVRIYVEVRGQIMAVRIYFPLLITNGADNTEIKSCTDGFIVKLKEFTYSIKAVKDNDIVHKLLNVEAPNRNGIYKVGFLERPGNSIGCWLQLR